MSGEPRKLIIEKGNSIGWLKDERLFRVADNAHQYVRISEDASGTLIATRGEEITRLSDGSVDGKDLQMPMVERITHTGKKKE